METSINLPWSRLQFSHIAYILMKVRPENLNLNSAYITAQTDKECEAWKQGLKFLIEEAVNAPYPLQIERWLRKEFYAIENSNEKLVLLPYFLEFYIDFIRY